MGEGNTKQTQRRVIIIAERCKGCGFCIEFCPKHVLHESTEINSQGYHQVYIDDSGGCTGCNICGMICPDFAIYVVPIEKKSEEKQR